MHAWNKKKNVSFLLSNQIKFVKVVEQRTLQNNYHDLQQALIIILHHFCYKIR